MKRQYNKCVIKRCFHIIVFMLGLVSCAGEVRITRTLDTPPVIFPDYTDVTIPANIAPLHFKLADSIDYDKAQVVFETGTQHLTLEEKKGQFAIPASSWKKLMKDAAGSTLRVTVRIRQQDQWAGFQPFQIFVAP